MLFPALLPLLLAAFIPPPSSFCLLLPPEGPQYDLPSFQYLPHNTLASYNHQGLASPTQVVNEGHSPTRSANFPKPSSTSTSSSSSSSCTVEDVARFLRVDDLADLVSLVSGQEGMSVEEVLLRLALKHGLHMKEKEHPIKKPVRELQAGTMEAADQRPITASDDLQDLTFDPSSSSSSPSSSSSSRQSFLHQQRPPPPPPPAFLPPSTHWQEDDQMYQPVANEVPAATPLPSHPPSALLVVVGEEGEEVVRSEVRLGPHMALLDALNQATSSYALQYGPYVPNPLAIKVRQIPSERCLGLQSIGSVEATPGRPLYLSVTRTRPMEQSVWESVCLPRVSELIIHRGDIIVLAPR